MATSRRDNETGEFGSGVAARAGAFLEINYAGGSKDKRIARDLGISPNMAKILRAGHGWTVARIDQAMRLWPAFREFVFAPPGDQLARRLEQLAAGFARLSDELAAQRAVPTSPTSPGCAKTLAAPGEHTPHRQSGEGELGSPMDQRERDQIAQEILEITEQQKSLAERMAQLVHAVRSGVPAPSRGQLDRDVRLSPIEGRLAKDAGS